tara:strand:+ start:682 stop:1209 length:528 start_codon:yes stop_codon:yes gene_type:complete
MFESYGCELELRLYKQTHGWFFAMKKEDRAAWLAKYLDEKGIALYGRASRISRDLKCAKAAATGWLNGTLPRDMELGMRFCEFYGIDLKEWVLGEKTKQSYLDQDRLNTALTIIRKFEEDTEVRWDIIDFIEQVYTIMEDPKYHERHLNDVIDLNRRMKMRQTIAETKICGTDGE